jgi:hypothetical protein
MDLHAYHQALNLGFSESEASRIGDDAWENNRQQPTCELEPEPDYYDVVVAENTQLRSTISLLEAKLEIEQIRLVACREQIAAYEVERAQMQQYYRRAIADRDDAKATITRLREYARHKSSCKMTQPWQCDAYNWPPRPCDCGYDALLAALEDGKP